jgi:hypothetical protein
LQFVVRQNEFGLLIRAVNAMDFNMATPSTITIPDIFEIRKYLSMAVPSVHVIILTVHVIVCVLRGRLEINKIRALLLVANAILILGPEQIFTSLQLQLALPWPFEKTSRPGNQRLLHQGCDP